MVVKEGTIFQQISKNKKFLDNDPKTIDNFAFLGYTNLKNREGWYDHGDSTERILASRNFTTQNTFARVHVCMRFSGVNHFTPVFVSKISIRTGSIASCSLT